MDRPIPVSFQSEPNTSNRTFQIVLALVVIFVGFLLIYYIYKSNKQEKIIERLAKDVEQSIRGDEALELVKQYYSSSEVQLPMMRKVHGVLETRLNDFDNYLRIKLAQSDNHHHNQQQRASTESKTEEKVNRLNENDNKNEDNIQQVVQSNDPPPLVDEESKQSDRNSTVDTESSSQTIRNQTLPPLLGDFFSMITQVDGPYSIEEIRGMIPVPLLTSASVSPTQSNRD
jgi:uncharacterized membrane-anchored protein YjiN (DUF445 family)